MSWLPIVHVSHARQPGDILVAAPPYFAYDAYIEEDTQDNKHGHDDEEEHNEEGPIALHQGAGHGPLKPSEQGGNERV